MKKLLLAFGIILAVTAYAADIKISQLPLGSAAATGALDSFPYVASSVNATKRLSVWDISNIPTIVSTYATKANPVFTGTLTAPSIVVSGLTATTVPYLNGSKVFTSSAVTPTELGYLSGVTSGLQTQLNAKQSNVLTDAHILVGNGSNVATDVAVSGDIGISNAGATTIQSGVVTNSKVSASAAISFSKLATLTSGNILVGSGSNVATSVAVSGDVTLSNAGVTAIGSNKVANSQLAQVAAHTFKGNNTGSTANATDMTVTQATAELNAVVGDSGSGGTKGLAPAPAAGDAAAGKFLKADGTWTTPSGASITAYAFSGYTSGISWGSTTNSFGDFSVNSGTAVLNTRQNTNFGSVTTAGSNLPGITFTAPATGSYYICGAPVISQGTAGKNSYLRLIDSNSVVVATSLWRSDSGGSAGARLSICSIINYTASSTITIKLQVENDASGNTQVLNNNGQGVWPIEWTIYKIN